MVSFSAIDLTIIFLFFGIVLLIGFIAGRKKDDTAENYLLSGRKVGLFLFVLTNVSTWYGGILGIGEFSYRYGLASWFTQGFPYYVFAFIFAVFFAKKIRKASLFTIPDKLQEVYGKKVGITAAVLIFILVSPAPYLLMIGNLLSIILKIEIFPALLIGIFLSVAYLFKGGYSSDLYTDAFEFFIMFAGFIFIFFSAYFAFGGMEYLETNLPPDHLTLTGGNSPVYILVWFFIALWTFTDPGFHQRCYAAKTESVAFKGILISIFFWALFDFLTNATGLYARALLPNLEEPVLAFPLLAEKILGPGAKGLFYAGLFATILSTLNSFLFLSATTFGRDLVTKIKTNSNDKSINNATKLGLLISTIISVILAYYIDSVIELWYMIGSLTIPGIIFLIFGAYYTKLKIPKNIAFVESIAAVFSSLIWLLIRPIFSGTEFYLIEPMIIGLIFGFLIHLYGMKKQRAKGRGQRATFK